MNEAVVVSDIHEGINFGFRVHPETGVSERAMDLHRNFARAAQYAIQAKSPLFIIAGDLFDRTHVSPTFREMVRHDVIEPLGKAGIKVWILAGNHDQPRIATRGTSLEDYRGYPHVRVFREPASEVVKISGKDVGFIILPYLHPEQITERVREKLGKDVPREQMFDLGKKLWKEWMRARCSELKTHHRILLGHYYFEGAKVRSISYPEVLPGEFSFTKDMLPDEIDLAILGHIHLHQTLDGRIVYTGAPERIDWGERGDDKGFLSVDLDSLEWKFLKLPAREMIKLDIDATEGDPTEAMMNALPSEMKGAMVRLEVAILEGMRSLVNDRKIAERLRDCFHYEVNWSLVRKEKMGVAEFTMDPVLLFEQFVKANYRDHPRLEQILTEGGRILKEVLQ